MKRRQWRRSREQHRGASADVAGSTGAGRRERARRSTSTACRSAGGLAAVPRAHRRLRARPARLRQLRQARPLRLLDRRLRRASSRRSRPARTRALSLVVHDWGASGSRSPRRCRSGSSGSSLIERRAVRCRATAGTASRACGGRRCVGELSMGYSFKAGMRRLARVARRARPAPRRWSTRSGSHWDHGTQRAILKLYRSARPPARAGGRAARRRKGAGARPVGRGRPYLPPSFAQVWRTGSAGRPRST